MKILFGTLTAHALVTYYRRPKAKLTPADRAAQTSSVASIYFATEEFEPGWAGAPCTALEL